MRNISRRTFLQTATASAACAVLWNSTTKLMADPLGLPLGFLLCFGLKKGIYGLWIGLTLALVVIAITVLLRWQHDSARPAA